MSKSRWFPTITEKVLAIFYIILVIWWISIFLRGIHETTENYLYSLAYGLMPLVYGILGFFSFNRWGRFKSSLGRATLFLSMGIFLWGIGNLIYAYYNLVLRVPIPYPSYADFGFCLLYPLSALGVISFFRVTGAAFALRQMSGKLFILIIPITLIFLSYYLLFVVARGGIISFEGDLLKLVLDIAYPVGDVVVITLAAIVYGLSIKYLGGFFRLPIVLICIGFAFAYITDFSFSYTTTTGSFFVGNWVDLLYTTTFFVISFGLSLLDPRSLNASSSS